MYARPRKEFVCKLTLSNGYLSQVNILAYDYTGYGISEGDPSEEACYADIEAAFAYLVNVKKSPPSKIILYELLLDSLT